MGTPSCCGRSGQAVAVVATKRWRRIGQSESRCVGHSTSISDKSASIMLGAAPYLRSSRQFANSVRIEKLSQGRTIALRISTRASGERLKPKLAPPSYTRLTRAQAVGWETLRSEATHGWRGHVAGMLRTPQELPRASIDIPRRLIPLCPYWTPVMTHANIAESLPLHASLPQRNYLPGLRRRTYAPGIARSRIRAGDERSGVGGGPGAASAAGGKASRGSTEGRITCQPPTKRPN